MELKTFRQEDRVSLWNRRYPAPQAVVDAFVEVSPSWGAADLSEREITDRDVLANAYGLWLLSCACAARHGYDLDAIERHGADWRDPEAVLATAIGIVAAREMAQRYDLAADFQPAECSHDLLAVRRLDDETLLVLYGDERHAAYRVSVLWSPLDLYAQSHHGGYNCNPELVAVSRGELRMIDNIGDATQRYA